MNTMGNAGTVPIMSEMPQSPDSVLETTTEIDQSLCSPPLQRAYSECDEVEASYKSPQRNSVEPPSSLDDFVQVCDPAAIQNILQSILDMVEDLALDSSERDAKHKDLSPPLNPETETEFRSSASSDIDSPMEMSTEPMLTKPLVDSSPKKRDSGSPSVSYHLLVKESSPKMSPISNNSNQTHGSGCDSFLFSDYRVLMDSPCDPTFNKTFKELESVSFSDGSEPSSNSLDHLKVHPSPDTCADSENTRHSLSKMMENLKIQPSPIEDLPKEEPLNVDEVAKKLEYHDFTPMIPKSAIEVPTRFLFNHSAYNSTASNNPKSSDGSLEISSPDTENNPPEESNVGATAESIQALRTNPVSAVIAHLKSRVEPLSPKNVAFYNPTLTKDKPKVKSGPVKPIPKTAAIAPSVTTGVRPQISKPRTNSTGNAKPTEASATSTISKKYKFDLTKSVYAPKTVPKPKGNEATSSTKPRPPIASSSQAKPSATKTGLVQKTTGASAAKSVPTTNRGVPAKTSLKSVSSKIDTGLKKNKQQ